jgi:hypothetical protein
MIKTINSPSPWLTVNSGGQPYVGTNSSEFAGSVRFNTQYSRLEAYDGNTWVQIDGGYASVEPSNRMIEILDWAQKKMTNEQEIQKRIKTNPTVADAYTTYQEAAEKLSVVMRLTDENN